MGLFGKSKEEQTGCDIRAVLADCAARRVPALLFGHHTGQTVDGLCLSTTDTTVTFALRAQPGEAGVEVMSLWCVSFTHGGRAHVFLASVVRTTPGTPPRVTLQLPAQIAVAEGRFSFRTPVVVGTTIGIRLITASGGAHTPDVLDVSLGGAQVRFPPAKDPLLAVGTKLTVEISMDRNRASLAALVRRRDAGRYGLQFSEVFQNGELVAPDGLRQIVRALELRWLREE